MKIREIKYLRMFKFYIDSNSKASRFAKLSTCKDGSNLQFAKLSPREIKVFYSRWFWLPRGRQTLKLCVCGMMIAIVT